MGGQFQGNFLAKGIGRLPQPLTNGPGHQSGKDPEQNPGIQSGDLPISQLPGGQAGHGDQQRQFLAQNL